MHLAALQIIGRYLLKSSEKEIILQPTLEPIIDCYMDANFSGLWNWEDPYDESVLNLKLAMFYVFVTVQFFGSVTSKKVLHPVQWKLNM